MPDRRLRYREVIAYLSRIQIGILNEDHLHCDWACNSQIYTREEVEVFVGMVADPEGMQRYIDKLKASGEFDKVISPDPFQPDVYISCKKCFKGKIENPTLGTDEWLFRGHIGMTPSGKRCLADLVLVAHSPASEGTKQSSVLIEP